MSQVVPHVKTLAKRSIFLPLSGYENRLVWSNVAQGQLLSKYFLGQAPPSTLEMHHSYIPTSAQSFWSMFPPQDGESKLHLLPLKGIKKSSVS